MLHCGSAAAIILHLDPPDTWQLDDSLSTSSRFNGGTPNGSNSLPFHFYLMSEMVNKLCTSAVEKIPPSYRSLSYLNESVDYLQLWHHHFCYRNPSMPHGLPRYMPHCLQLTIWYNLIETCESKSQVWCGCNSWGLNHSILNQALFLPPRREMWSKMDFRFTAID